MSLIPASMTGAGMEEIFRRKGESAQMKKMEEYVRAIPDFPEPGIIFRDVTSVLQDPEGLKLAIDSMIGLLEGVEFDVIAGTESRGFMFGVPIAYQLGKSFVPVRKKGSCRVRRFLQNMTWSTALPRLKCIRMPLSLARRLCL